MEVQHQRPRLARPEAVVHDRGPHPAGGAELRDLLEEIVVDVEEEGQAGAELIDVESPPHGRVDVGDAVGEREAELLGGRTTCLAHVVAADRDRVPARNVLGAEGEHVGDDAERGRGRIDVGAARGILLEHVVLDGAADLRPRDTLLLRYREVEAEENHPRRVDGHRGGDAIERNTGEQRLHVLERGDRDPDPTDLAPGERVVGVAPHLSRQVEGD